MSLFSYKAIDSKGRNQFGTLDASSESDLELRLSRMGMDLIRCKFVEEKGKKKKFKSSAGNVSKCVCKWVSAEIL